MKGSVMNVSQFFSRLVYRASQGMVSVMVLQLVLDPAAPTVLAAESTAESADTTDCTLLFLHREVTI